MGHGTTMDSPLPFANLELFFYYSVDSGSLNTLNRPTTFEYKKTKRTPDCLDFPSETANSPESFDSN